jgi:hypothetical protein
MWRIRSVENEDQSPPRRSMSVGAFEFLKNLGKNFEPLLEILLENY